MQGAQESASQKNVVGCNDSRVQLPPADWCLHRDPILWAVPERFSVNPKKLVHWLFFLNYYYFFFTALVPSLHPSSAKARFICWKRNALSCKELQRLGALRAEGPVPALLRSIFPQVQNSSSLFLLQLHSFWYLFWEFSLSCRLPCIIKTPVPVCPG